MFVVRVSRLDNSVVPLEKERFAQLPIRIGRNPLNDVCLNHNMVSAFHARIEDDNGKLCLRDLGSKNGVFVMPASSTSPTRVTPETPVDLSLVGYRFFVASVFRVDLEMAASDGLFRQSMANGQVLGNPSMLANTPFPSGYPGQPQGWSPDLGVPSPGYAGWPGAPAPPPYASPPPQQQYSPPARASGPPNTQFLDVGLETMALQGLRELAGSLIPGCPLETTGDVARFITKLHDALDVFCRTFVPLRDGYAQFVSSLDLQQAASQRSVNRSRACLTLETASAPDAIAMALLNPRDPAFDAPAAVEGIMADLMLHQVALLDGVMQGVKALLDELSPENIDASVQEENRVGILGNRNRARWDAFRERFERLSDEKQAFSMIFGQQFTQVYRQYWRKEGEGGADQRLRTERPR